MPDTKAYRDTTTDPELNAEVCAWLRANDIDPRLVSKGERPQLSDNMRRSFPKLDHDADMVLDIRLRKSGADGHGLVLNAARTTFVEEQHTLPIRIAPSPAVREWLEGRCPTCER